MKLAHGPNAKGTSQKDIVLDDLDAVIADVSGDGEYRFAVRQLLYALRPIVRDELDQELQLGNFTKIITDYEAEYGEIPGMYREPRGRAAISARLQAQYQASDSLDENIGDTNVTLTHRGYVVSAH